MANIAANANADYSVGSTWVGGVVPGSGDVAYANGFTVTISDTRTVQAISNAAATGITVGGTFSLLNGCNLTCTNANGVVQGNTTTSCVTTPSLALGNTATVAASFTNQTTTANGHAVTFSTAGTLNWTGNVIGGSGSSNTQYGVNITGTGIFNGTGNYTGGTLANSHALNVSGNATVAITGNVTGGGSSATGITMNNGGVTVNGNVTGSSGASNGGGIANTGSTTLTVNGACQSGTVSPAIMQGSTTQITRLSGPFLLGASGNINPVQAASWRWAPTQIPTYFEVSTSGGTTKRSLYTADNMPSGGYPTAANVRSGTVYGPNSENTGTLAVPAVGSVALGVAVDNTTGTAILTAAALRSGLGMASANLDTQLAAAAADSAGTTTLLSRLTSTRATGLDNLDASVSSRLASASYTAPPSAASIRSEIDTNSAKLDVAVSSRLAPSGTLARVTLTDTATTLTNAPAVPSAATIASQVRTELSAELGRIDATISSRLAAASYSAAPSTAAIRTELSVELARLDVAVSSRSSYAGGDTSGTTTLLGRLTSGRATALDNLDAAVSSRLAPSDTLARVTLVDTTTTVTNATSSSAPTAQQNAAAVRSELSAELARIANCSTVDTTATTIQDALSAD